MDGDEIYTCQINALWKAHVNFKPERKAKFTTYLFNGVFIECLKAVKFKNKLSDHAVKLHDNISSGNLKFLTDGAYGRTAKQRRKGFNFRSYE